MVENQIRARGVADPRVLAAMGALPRHLFVNPGQEAAAYEDHPLPIGRGQTISQPYIVAFMAEALALRGTEKVLEVGCGCGYLAAVLARLCRRVFGIDLELDLVRGAQARLEALGIANATLRCGDGKLGWRSEAPFDAIVLSCAADAIPPDLWEQVAEGGRLLLPLAVHPTHQDLVLVHKVAGAAVIRNLLPVVFVPLR